MELRLKREAAGKKYQGTGVASERLVKREICNVLTKGTFIDSKTRGEDAYEPRYVLALKRSGNILGVTFFDVSTLKFFIGQFLDDEVFSSFRTLICQIRPIEVLHEREMVNSDLIKMLKNQPAAPVFSCL